MKNSNIDKLFGSIGFGFPENEKELKAFDEVFKGYQFVGDEEKIDPKKIFDNIKSSNTKISKIDYHKRTVLAAEIVFKLYTEPTLGHLKLQKIMYLCQHTTGMRLHTNFLKQAMGPYDPKLMRSIDKQFKLNKWYQYDSNEYVKYKPLENVGGHRDWYSKYFKNEITDIDFLLEKFKFFRTDQIEIVATIFACWKEIIDSRGLVNNEMIIKKFYSWHKDKAKYTKDRLNSAIEWMTSEGIHPV
ncbi:hypothetical protein DNU06_07055 [Putridiphycobacter roseus]|uniref:Uncharacterized protein n=1 Tax=Putridiphycobacter roseus TaxID=2219161 RepID=A0A2W1N1Y8_9FLAO|nr:hypothetical protein [Putridiphycobacter roseus]PZE17580.1 hypothetical protein DNU06_07055 [Putridiphycobacter roseus]